MENKKFGYGRVSTKYQNERRQVEDFLKFGVSERDIYIDKASSRNFDRPKYQALKQCLRKGDLLYIHSLDRLGRNRQAVNEEWRELTKEIGVDIKVLDMSLLDTTLYKDTLGSFVSDLALQIIGYNAEKEYEDIKKSQREGIEAAKKYGTKTGRPFGRPKVKKPDNFDEVVNRWKNKEITAVAAMKELGLSKPTFYKMIKEDGGK